MSKCCQYSAIECTGTLTMQILLKSKDLNVPCNSPAGTQNHSPVCLHDGRYLKIHVACVAFSYLKVIMNVIVNVIVNVVVNVVVNRSSE